MENPLCMWLVPLPPYIVLFLLLISPDNINFAVYWKISPPPPLFKVTEQIYVQNCNTCKNKWKWLIVHACVQSVQYYSDKRNQDVGRLKLAPWSTALHEKIRVPQIVDKLSEFYGIRNIITAFTRVASCGLPWARLTQVIPFQSISLIPTLILFLHLHECHKSSLFPNMSFYFLMCATCPANLLLYLINQSQSARDKNLSSSVCYFCSLIFHLCPISFSSTLLSKIFSLLCSSLTIGDHTSHPYKTVRRTSHIFCMVQSIEICPSGN